MNFVNFLIKLSTRGLEQFGLFYSVYRGECVSNQDPEALGRIRVKCPQVYGANIPERWAWPRPGACGVDQGLFDIPEPGDPVWLEFEMGNASHPVWSPGWWGKRSGCSEVPFNARLRSPTRKTWKMKNGARLTFETASGSEFVEIIASDGSYLRWDSANGKVVELDKGDREAQIMGSESKTVKADETRLTGGTDSKTVMGDQVRQIAGNRQVSVLGSVLHTILGSVQRIITGSETVVIAGAKTEAMASRATVLQGGWTIKAGGPVDVTAKSVTVTATDAVAVTAPNIALNGVVTINGQLDVTGNISATGSNPNHHSH